MIDLTVLIDVEYLNFSKSDPGEVAELKSVDNAGPRAKNGATRHGTSTNFILNELDEFTHQIQRKYSFESSCV